MADAEYPDLLVQAARAAKSEGLTKAQFMANADVFWDSWEKMASMLEASSNTEPNQYPGKQ